MCGECFERHAPNGTRESIEAECGRCGEHKTVYSTNVRLCFPCLDDPANFQGNKAALVDKHKRMPAIIAGKGD
jgi:hypothetical protein